MDIMYKYITEWHINFIICFAQKYVYDISPQNYKVYKQEIEVVFQKIAFNTPFSMPPIICKQTYQNSKNTVH